MIMCGIAGWVAGKDGKGVTAGRLAAAMDEIRPRGPDMEGMVGWGMYGAFLSRAELTANHDAPLKIGFAHSRLSIFDLSRAGIQPMQGYDGIWIVYNGEIYNHTELREELQKLGYTFQTRTDTEVAAAAYVEWGEKCVTKFNGMWSMAIYDSRQQRLFCSRDRLGVKPFYWCRPAAGGFAFASTPEAVLALLGAEAAIDPAQLGRYLIARINDDQTDTLYKDIKLLPAGSSGVLDLSNGQWKITPYWRLPEDEDLELSDDQALDRFQELLEDAVALRFRADVPVALTLSGGVDSSALAVAASRVGIRPTAYTSHFPTFSDIDESAFAKQAAEAKAIDHVLVTPSFDDMLEGEGQWAKAQGMPFGSLSGFIHWSIMKEIRSRGTIVVLSGQGGDELFWGYESYVPYFVFENFFNLPKVIRRWRVAANRIRLSWPLIPAYYAAYRLPFEFVALRVFYCLSVCNA